MAWNEESSVLSTFSIVAMLLGGLKVLTYCGLSKTKQAKVNHSRMELFSMVFCQFRF